MLALIALALLAALAVAVVGAAVVKVRQDAAAAAARSTHYLPPNLRALGVGPPPRVVIVGDGTLAPVGPSSSNRWPALIATGSNLRFSTAVVPSAGYLPHAAAGSRTFGTLVTSVSRDADVILFVGGVHDAGGDPIKVAAAATRAIAAARKRAPQATILVVGPVSTAGNRVTALRGVLRAAANLTSATWVDAAPWLEAAGSTSAAGTRITRSGQRDLAAHFSSVLRTALGGP